MNKAGRCVHFNGIQNVWCKKEIIYADVRSAGPLPCITINGRRPDTCLVYQEPTAEQIAADEKEYEEARYHLKIVLRVVDQWRTWKPNHKIAKRGVIECPACFGRLHLSQSAINGHVHGKCKTPGCVEWME